MIEIFTLILQCYKNGVHYVITLYKADKFTGELKSSEEGRVYWIPLEELKTKELATGMEHVLRILESEKVDECYMHLEADGYVGDLEQRLMDWCEKRNMSYHRKQSGK